MRTIKKVPIYLSLSKKPNRLLHVFDLCLSNNNRKMNLTWYIRFRSLDIIENGEKDKRTNVKTQSLNIDVYIGREKKKQSFLLFYLLRISKLLYYLKSDPERWQRFLRYFTIFMKQQNKVDEGTIVTHVLTSIIEQLQKEKRTPFLFRDEAEMYKCIEFIDYDLLHGLSPWHSYVYIHKKDTNTFIPCTIFYHNKCVKRDVLDDNSMKKDTKTISPEMILMNMYRPSRQSQSQIISFRHLSFTLPISPDTKNILDHLDELYLFICTLSFMDFVRVSNNIDTIEKRIEIEEQDEIEREEYVDILSI